MNKIDVTRLEINGDKVNFTYNNEPTSLITGDMLLWRLNEGIISISRPAGKVGNVVRFAVSGTQDDKLLVNIPDRAHFLKLGKAFAKEHNLCAITSPDFKNQAVLKFI